MKKLRKLLLLLLSVVMIITSMTIQINYADNNTRFVDVPSSHWAYVYVEEMAQSNIISGMDSTHFAPDAQITRAQFANLIVRALGLPLIYEDSSESIFDDIPANAWYAPFVRTAHDADIVSGISVTQFAPQANITREQLAVMTMNAYFYANSETAAALSAHSNLTFTDVDLISPWALDSVKAACVKGIIDSEASASFIPKNTATRAEAAKVIYIMNSLRQKPGTPTPTITPKRTPKPTPTPAPTRKPTPIPTIAPTAKPTPTAPNLRIATTLIQLSNDTREKILNSIDRLIGKTVTGCNPDMVVLSEILYQRRLTDVKQPSYKQGEVMPGEYTDFIAAEAVKYNVYIVFNLLQKCDDGKMRNCEAIMDRSGNIVGKYYKMHLPSEETPYSIPGEDANVIATEFGKIGFNVCYDLDPAFNQDIAAAQAAKGAKLIISSSIGEYWKGAQDAAKSNGIYTVISGQMAYNFYETGNVDDPISGVFGPDGTVLAGCDDPTAHGKLNNATGGNYCYADIPLSNIN